MQYCEASKIFGGVLPLLRRFTRGQVWCGASEGQGTTASIFPAATAPCCRCCRGELGSGLLLLNFALELETYLREVGSFKSRRKSLLGVSFPALLCSVSRPRPPQRRCVMWNQASVEVRRGIWVCECAMFTASDRRRVALLKTHSAPSHHTPHQKTSRSQQKC